MKYILIYITFIPIVLSCASTREVYDEKKGDSEQFIELGSMIGHRSLLLKDGTLIKEKRGFLGFWKTKSVQVDDSIAQSIFELTQHRKFKSLPNDIDKNCVVTLKKKVTEPLDFGFISAYQPPEVFNSLGYFGYRMHQIPTTIVIKDLSSLRRITWQECYPLSESSLDIIRKKIESDSTIVTEFDQVMVQSSVIAKNLNILSEFKEKFYSLLE